MNVVIAAVSASLFLAMPAMAQKSEVKRSQPFQAQERCETGLQGSDQELCEVAQKATQAPSGNQESNGRQ